MPTHGNSPLGIEGRRRLVDLMLGGLSTREAAARRGVSVATAHRWITRWNQASDAQQRSLECLLDRSSPRRPRADGPCGKTAVRGRISRSCGLFDTRVARWTGDSVYLRETRGSEGSLESDFCLLQNFRARRRKGGERVNGIEPSSEAWKATALPLSYTRMPPAA